MTKPDPFKPRSDGAGGVSKYQPMRENPAVKWFEKQPAVDCVWCHGRRKADGILRGTSNESFGPHCSQCASRRIHDAERVRAALAEGGKGWTP